jgi:hypothetical protein
MTARIFNTLLGTWLFLSAFFWPHTAAQRVTAIVCGLLTALTAVIAIYSPRVRYLTALVAVILFVLSLSTAGAMNQTFWHNAVVAIAVFIAALFDRGTVGAGSPRWRDSSDQLSEPVH